MFKNKEFNQNINVPNSLCALRIACIPFFCYYFLEDELPISILIMVISGISDALDGFIARKFNQITELGKILDPFADKLTQVAIALCLCIKYPKLCPFFILMLIKEVSMLIFATRLLTLKKKPGAAKWYGKVATVLFYISTIITVFLSKINMEEFYFDIITSSLMLLTAVMMMYAWKNYYNLYKKLLKSNNPNDEICLKEHLIAKK
ncbi:MAG: CDP-alcohol phosphatidyltransferase family protein [Clostridia bacterium]